MRKGWIEHSDQGRKQKSTTGKSSGSICVYLLLLIHDISAGRVHFTDTDTETCEHFVQDSIMPWALDSQNHCHYFCSVLIQTSVVSQKAPFSISASLLVGSVISLFFSFSRKKSQNRMVQQPGNLMAFPLMPQPIPLSFLNSRVSCIHMSSLQENENLDEPINNKNSSMYNFSAYCFAGILLGTIHKSSLLYFTVTLQDR